MKPSAKIYLAGHEGLVGSAFLRLLKKSGYTNITTRPFKDLDLRNQKQTEQFFTQEKPEYVFLAAAKVGGILANNTYKAEFIYDNLMIAANVINAAHKVGVKKLLNLGSSCIYPKLAPQPINENSLLTGPLEPTNEPYAIAKIAAIKLCRYFNEQYNTNFISVMPTNLYGPKDSFNLQTAHVLPTLIRKFHLGKLLQENNVEAIKNDLIKRPFSQQDIASARDKDIKNILISLGITASTITIWGTGKPFREFLFVDDLTSACLHLMRTCDHKDIGEFVNIGTGKDVTIKDLALLIQKVVGFSGNLAFDTSKPDGTPRKLLDVSKLHKLGWQHTIELADGITKTYQWYLESLQ